MSHDVDDRDFDPEEYQVAARMGGLKVRTVECPKCKSTNKMTFKANRFSHIRDATQGIFKCGDCGHEWSDRRYWRVRYENLELVK